MRYARGIFILGVGSMQTNYMHRAMALGLVDSWSDDDLQRAWFDDEEEDDGLAFNEVYRRYRNIVRDEMQRAGLGFADAEKRVGSVFLQARYETEDIPMNTGLGDRLLSVARRVAADANWMPPK